MVAYSCGQFGGDGPVEPSSAAACNTDRRDIHSVANFPIVRNMIRIGSNHHLGKFIDSSLLLSQKRLFVEFYGGENETLRNPSWLGIRGCNDG